MKTTRRILIAVFSLLFLGNQVNAQEPFAQTVGNVQVGTVSDKTPLAVPYITWGGDVATFLANGGLDTANESIYAQAGLKLKLTSGDDFIGQVKNYLSGETPFLRGTMRMIGQASEVLGRDPRTKPVVIMQLSWSAGDHIVSRENLKTLNDLRGANGKKIRIACQKGGPHVGLLYDSLDAATIARNEVEVVWVDDLTGPNGPAEKFRSDATVDACCVITPDMIGLTGGLDGSGSGLEGTVKGAHVLNSTASMSRSIADVYCVRSDWYQANRDTVEKFVAGYLKASKQLVQMRDDFEKTKRLAANYRNILATSQTIFGRDVINSLEVDGHGLLLDCTFVGLSGQVAFFEDTGNLSGFNPVMSKALDLATTWGYAKVRTGFDPSGLDYKKVATIAGLEYVQPKAQEGGFAEGVEFFPGDQLDDRTIVSFTINFEPNQTQFSADRYGAEFNRAIKSASTFGNAVVVIRGHADPTKALTDFLNAGIKQGVIKRVGQRGNYRYFLNGKQIDLANTEDITKLISTGRFEHEDYKPQQTVNAALNLSKSRAEEVRNSLIDLAKKQGVNLDPSQMQPAGAGISEPIIPKPSSLAQAKENMRVEFRIVRVPAENLNPDAFDF
ncbi:MAG: hypothetical protein KDB27_12360 [Planctomycetales bacterium]|nr:hypothetical protein [Planctomycetales bacterium]